MAPADPQVAVEGDCGLVAERQRWGSRDHASRSIAASIDQARDILGYTPRYSSLDALHESLRWLAANGHVDVGGQDF
jgi:nucleoside-diphosphate-sugar epimerase